jgi:beta-phosphoglucomutase-like phosphatase (HAD superfamily)
MREFNFEAIYFDMDGTLIDSEPIWYACEHSLMAEFGYEWSVEDQKNCLGGPLLRAGEYMREKAGGVLTAQYFADELLRRVARDFESQVIFMDGALGFARKVFEAGIPTALVSASPRTLMDSCLAGLSQSAPDLAEMFSLSISLDDVTNSKPDPEGYLLAARQQQVDISRSLVIEDSATGVKAGIASGAWVLALPHIVKIEPHPRLRIRPNLLGLELSELVNLFLDAK